MAQIKENISHKGRHGLQRDRRGHMPHLMLPLGASIRRERGKGKKENSYPQKNADPDRSGQVPPIRKENFLTNDNEGKKRWYSKKSAERLPPT